MFTRVLVREFVFITFRGRFQQDCESFTAWSNSTAISSKCQIMFKWVDRSLDVVTYVSIFTLLTLWLSEASNPLPSHTITFLAT